MTNTPCCGAEGLKAFETHQVNIIRCATCSTLWVDHTGPKVADTTWQEPDLTPVFLKALGERRTTQAQQLLNWLPDLPPPILDYGCGQAIFFDKARQAGLDVWATDLALPAGSYARDTDRFITIKEPWTIPAGDWGTIVLLDVLEHHADPRAFLASLSAQRLVIKIPLLRGPSGAVARALARLGKPNQLENLLLVGEANPHRAFFTSKGLISVAAPRRLVSRRQIADVGTELPERMTGRELGWKGLPLSAAGGGLAAISRIWSDTAVFVFDHDPATSP